MKSSKNMTIAFLLNFSFAILEFIFVFMFNSSAVLADAVHDTGDAMSIGLSTLFEKISNKKEDKKSSFQRFLVFICFIEYLMNQEQIVSCLRLKGLLYDGLAHPIRL